jgi:hypothetical protein
MYILSPQRCLHLVVVVGLVQLCDPESNGGSRLTTSRATHAGKVKGYSPDYEGHPGPPGWGMGMGLTTPSCNK